MKTEIECVHAMPAPVLASPTLRFRVAEDVGSEGFRGSMQALMTGSPLNAMGQPGSAALTGAEQASRSLSTGADDLEEQRDEQTEFNVTDIATQGPAAQGAVPRSPARAQTVIPNGPCSAASTSGGRPPGKRQTPVSNAQAPTAQYPGLHLESAQAQLPPSQATVLVSQLPQTSPRRVPASTGGPVAMRGKNTQPLSLPGNRAVGASLGESGTEASWAGTQLSRIDFDRRSGSDAKSGQLEAEEEQVPGTPKISSQEMDPDTKSGEALSRSLHQVPSAAVAEPGATGVVLSSLHAGKEVLSGHDIEGKTGFKEISASVLPSPQPHAGASVLFGTTGEGKDVRASSPTPTGQVSTAQVLQRMDAAVSSGAVQLRADARHLDVGIQSATLGWVEIRATPGAPGQVEASLRAQSDASAHVLASQAADISNYVREQSVSMGQLSVSVGTGDSARQQARSGEQRSSRGETPDFDTRVGHMAASEVTYRVADTLSLISVRA